MGGTVIPSCLSIILSSLSRLLSGPLRLAARPPHTRSAEEELRQRQHTSVLLNLCVHTEFELLSRDIYLLLLHYYSMENVCGRPVK